MIFHFVNAKPHFLITHNGNLRSERGAKRSRGRCPLVDSRRRFGQRDRGRRPPRWKYARNPCRRTLAETHKGPGGQRGPTNRTHKGGGSPRDLRLKAIPAIFATRSRALPSDTYVGTISANLYANSPCSSGLTCCSS